MLNLNVLIQGLKEMTPKKKIPMKKKKIMKKKIIQQEDENLKKLKHVEIENRKLKDTQRKLRSELGSCEKTVVILKKQLEDFEKLGVLFRHSGEMG
jgi:hypothetical protein